MAGLARAPRTLRTTLALMGVALFALAFAACSGSGSGSGTGAGGAGSSPVATSTVDLPPSYRFAPVAITVAAGTTVTWTNHDNFSHSVQFLDGGLPTDPQLMKPGESTTFTFETPGTFKYQCHLHPQQMQGTVTVTQ